MTRPRTAALVYTLLRLVMGLLFVYAGVLKLMDPMGFATTINYYGLVSWRMANSLSYAIPCVEILTGLGLVLDFRGALALIVAQLLGFMCILLYAVHIGLDKDCGCFGTPRTRESEPAGPLEAFARDGLMFVACMVMYWLRRRLGTRLRSLRRPLAR